MKKIIFLFLSFLFITTNVKAENIEYIDYISTGYKERAFYELTKTDAGNYLFYDLVWNSLQMYNINFEAVEDISCRDIALSVNGGMLCFEYELGDVYNISIYTDNLTTPETINKSIALNYNYIAAHSKATYENGYYIILNNHEDYLILNSNLNLVENYDVSTYETIYTYLLNEYDYFDFLDINDGMALVIAGRYYSYDVILFDSNGDANIIINSSTHYNYVGSIYNNKVYLIYISKDNSKYYLNKYNTSGTVLSSYDLNDIVGDALTLSSEYYLSDMYVDGEEILFANYTDYCSSALELHATSITQTYSATNDCAYIVRLGIIYDITVETDGFGLIEVDKTGSYKEQKIMQIVPEEGYMIKTLVITDADGNEIEYDSSYSFVMPNSDIVITATFEKVTNPETGAVLPILTLITLGSLGLGAYTYSKKNKKIHNI